IVSTGFFGRNLTKTANALGLFILSTGMLIVTNSSLPYYYYPDYGPVLFFLFDTFMLVLCPSLFYFVVRSFDEPFVWLKKAEKWLIGYYVACFAVMIVYKTAGGSFYFYYKLFTFWILAPLVMAQLLVTIVLAVRNAYRGYSNSMLLSIGIIALAVSGIAELIILFVRHGMYEFILWKFGLVFLIACLVMALNRRIAADYAKLLSYSKELELFNHQLEKTERMRILSEMAASIAHEIRNPLQVTRGFLQLLSGKATEDNRNQFGMAISELDRAAAIITDYLTFAKPEQEMTVSMDVKQQLDAIAMIIHPMVMLNGGVLQVEASDLLTIVGSPSKFKQALINMLKNSAESLQDNGKIEVKAYEDNATVVITITDNGQGMDEEQLAKLGTEFENNIANGRKVIKVD
ncbi:MAG: ATP-binding protein, partial [Cohnella sp.]|nr:ATP-binding protein [Cohnella sp.]